jgi:cystathionine gamma-lyase
MRFASRAIHSGQDPDSVTGATIVPIYQTSTFTQEEIGKHKGFEYSRTGNPTRQALETCLASLEEGRHGLAFASGLAATAGVLAFLKPGDHVVAAADLYGGTYRLFEKVYSRQGIVFTYVDGRSAGEFKISMRPETRLVWLETPTNPLLQLVDIAAVAEITQRREVPLVVDNTFASPFFQRPLLLGADAVVHSTTKYLGGHSDVVGGAIVTNDDRFYESAKFYQNAAGGIPGPFDCWLVLRGIKTLALRMKQHEVNAFRVAGFLQQHPFVKSVCYPGLPDHPQHELASRQMEGYGGMVSFRILGGRDQANTFFKSLRLFSFAESLGGVESLACYPSTMTHGSIPREIREQRGITEDLIRLSVGIEDPEDLEEDLAQALESTARGWNPSLAQKNEWEGNDD